MTGPCPDENALVRFSGGRLSGADLGAVEQHLDGCSACRTLIAQLASLHSKTLETPSGAGTAAALQGKVGRYHVERLVGGGGMGMVYAGRDRELNRVVAIKVLKTGGNEEARARLLREAQTMAKLSHPNLVPIFELGTERGDDFLAMELIDGPTLDFWLREKKRTWQEVVAKFIEAGRGLEAAHAAGVVHRDFKPANVLIGPDGRARVTDFGLARPRVPEVGPDADGASIELTREGSLLGTPAYMSPEQLDGQVADVRSDQFSFCVALVEALVGHRPFAGRTPGELRAAMKSGQAPELDLQPARLKKAVLKGMAVSPDARFASMSALLAELQGLLQPPRLKPGPLVLPLVGLSVVAVVAAIAARPAPSPDPVPAAAPAPAFEPPKTKVLELTVGQIQTVAVPGVQRVQTGKPEIASVRLIGNQQVEVTGVAPGEFFLILDTRAGPHEPITPVSLAIGVTHHGNRNFTMAVGEVRTLDVPGLTHLEAPDPEVVNARITGKAQVTVEGISGGRSLVKTFVQGSPYPLEWLIEVKAPLKPSLAEGEPILLSPGTQKVITVPGIQRVAIGDAAVTDVKTIGNSQLLLIGGDEGTTTLLIWKSDGTRASHVVTVKGSRRSPAQAPEPSRLPDAVALTDRISLSVGEQKVVRIAGLQRVAVGDAAIVDVKTIGSNRLLLIGEGAGKTTLLVWKGNGERASSLVSVTAAGSEREADELYSLIEGEQQRVAVKGVERIETQPPGIVEAKAEGRDGVVLSGLKAGRARVVVDKADGSKRTMDVQVQEGEVAREELALSVGEHKSIDLQSVQRVAVADPAVLEVQVVGKQLMLFGKGKGKTTLKAWGAQGARWEWDVWVSGR